MTKQRVVHRRAAKTAVQDEHVDILKEYYLAHPGLTFDKLSRKSEELIGTRVDTDVIKKLSWEDPDGRWNELRERVEEVLCPHCGEDITHLFRLSADDAMHQIRQVTRYLYEDIERAREEQRKVDAQQIKMWLELLDRSGVNFQPGSAKTSMDEVLDIVDSAMRNNER